MAKATTWTDTDTEVRKRGEQRGIILKLTNSAKEHIAEVGFDNVYGARPLKRALYEIVEDRLAELILEGRVNEGSIVEFDYANGHINVNLTTV